MKKLGRKPLQFTDELRLSVKQGAAFGESQKESARRIGISRTTFRKHLQKEFESGKSWANQAVARSLFWQATVGKNTTAAIWWEKTRAGMKEPTAHEHASANAPPPPKLGISFEDGSPGRVRRVPFELEQDHGNISATPESPDRLDGEPPHVESPQSQSQVYLPAPTTTPRSQWEILAMSPEEFNRLKGEASADAELDRVLCHQRPPRIPT